MRKLRSVTTAIAATGALAFAGCGGASSASQTSASGHSAPPTSGRGPGLSSSQLSSVASALGVSTARLSAAMKSAQPTTTGSRVDPSAAVAKALGLSQAKVQAALQKALPARGSGGPPSGLAPSGGRPRSGAASPTTA